MSVGGVRCLEVTKWWRFLIKNSIVPRLIKKFNAFYGTRRFIVLFTTVNQSSQSCFTWIQSTACRPVSESRFLILFSHLHLRSLCDLIPLDSPPKSCMYFSVCLIPRPYNPLTLGNTDDIQCFIYTSIIHEPLREVLFLVSPYSLPPSSFSVPYSLKSQIYSISLNWNNNFHTHSKNKQNFILTMPILEYIF